MKYKNFYEWFKWANYHNVSFMTQGIKAAMLDAWDAALENEADMLIKNKIQEVIDDTQGKEFKNIKGN